MQVVDLGAVSGPRGPAGIALTTLVVLAVMVPLCRVVVLRVPRRGRRYLWLLAVGVLSSSVVNLVVKGPLGLLATELAGAGRQLTTTSPLWLLLFALLIAPVAEEAIKIAPLVSGRVRRLVVDRVDALWVGITLGMSFGLGEIVWVAVTIAGSGEYATVPWYGFGGFATERLVVTFGHGVMTAVAVMGWWRGRALRGYLGAVALHLLANIGAFLSFIGAWSAELASTWTVATLVVLAAVFERMRRGAGRPRVELLAAGPPTSEPDLARGDPAIIYDGDCGFCRATLESIRREFPGLPPQVPWREAALGSVGLTSEECRAAVQYVEGGTVVASGADALARAVRSSRTARGRLVGGLVLVPGVRSVARWVYAVVARNRHRLSVLIS